MSLKLMTRPRPAPSQEIDSPEDIAEMMAEAARVDAMFQSGAISTLFPYAVAFAAAEPEPCQHASDSDVHRQLTLF
ncbi:hypothetical protein [Hyphomicrobium sp.]|jgi:hypothetical protein|uniref:hypothetical protein n=1 Tax=Hyphomicrobium sp. TaxID=82 RepID=UPI002B7B89F7|nr:hypothetical protein [Hyphomicrobium sp.]HVZ04993.1 hypothetical protein [Hyphomicrobium sp.]